MLRNNRLIVSVALVSEVLLLTGGLAACSKFQGSEALVAEAKEYQKKGETKAAIIQLKNALQKNPDDADARYLLGAIYYDAGDLPSAEKELRKALSLGANSAKVLPILGKTLLAQGQFQKVLNDIALPAGATADPELLALRGNAFLALGKAGEARESFSLALKQNPDFAEALIGSAKQSLLERDSATAASLVDKAIDKNPKNVDAWLFKGDLLRAQGKNEDALVVYAKAAELKPNNIAPHIARAHIHINAKQFDAANADLEAARKADSKSLLIVYTQALLEFSQGKHAKALESIQQVLRVAPEHMPSVLLAGAVQYALGSTQQAEQHLKKYLEQSPGNPYASRLLIAALLKNGDTARAVKLLTPMLAHGEKDPQLLTLAGETYMQARDFSKATDYFEKASALAPQAVMVRTALGMSRLAQGENARAIAELELATDLDGKPTEAGVLLVMTHMRLKEYDKALAALEKLEKAQPDNPLLQNLKGGVYLGKKDARAARSSFEKALALQPSYFPAVANLAQMDMGEKKPDAARKRLEAFLKVDKKNAQAMMGLARLALAEGRKDEATAWLERASNENPDDARSATVLASHYLQLGEKQKALALAQKLQTNNPASPEILDLLAQTQLANNDPTSALQNYKKLVALAPTSPAAQFRLASAHMAMQNQSAAAEALKAALALKPDYMDAQVALAALELHKGNHEQALGIARQIQKQSAKLSTGHVLEGDILLSQKKPELAVKAYERAYAISKNGPTVIKLHESLKLAGKEKEGEARLIQWLKEHPGDISTRMYFATASFMGQQNRTAIEQYQTVLQTDPKNLAALNNLALAYQQEKDSRALEFAEKAHALAPDNAAVLDTLGWILVERGDVGRGLPHLQKAVTLAPNAPDVRYHLAQGLAKSGDKAKARNELEQLLASQKSFSKIDEAKALLKQLQ